MDDQLDIPLFMHYTSCNDRHEKGYMMVVRTKKPVQVYLDNKRVVTLARLAQTLALSQADVLRRGLDLLAEKVLPVEDDPLLQLIGLAGTHTDSPGDLAARHDEYLSQWQEEDDGKR